MSREPRRSLGRMTVGNILKSAASRFGGREAVYCEATQRRLSFRDMNTRSNQLAHALRALALEPGDIVAFLCSNRIEILEIYGAIAKVGLVGLPLNYRLAPSELATLINALAATTLICDQRFGSVLDYIQAHCHAVRHYVWIGPSVPESCRAYEGLLASGSPDEPEADVQEQDAFYFNLTSGTTGLPKAYIVTHYSASALHSALLSYDARADDVLLTVFPAFGRMAFGSLLMSVVAGARNVLANFEPERVLDLIERESVTFVWLVPTMAALLLEVPGRSSRRIGSLRAIGFVGATLPASLVEQTRAQLCRDIYEGYGLQEAGMLTMSNPEDRVRKPGSVGLPVLFSEIRIVDSAGCDVSPGAIGEIVARSPNCITEYFQSPAKNLEAFREGWFHTGDLGRLDGDGYLYIAGRVKDMIISGGQNIYASEIESILLEMPGVADCAIIGLPHALWGEMVAAVLIVHNGAQLDAERVQDYCREKLAGFKIPRQVILQQEPLPRTATGKVQKFILVERYGGATAKEA